MSSGLRDSLPLFDGFPYLTTHVGGAIYHVILLPARLGKANQFPASRNTFERTAR